LWLIALIARFIPSRVQSLKSERKISAERRMIVHSVSISLREKVFFPSAVFPISARFGEHGSTRIIRAARAVGLAGSKSRIYNAPIGCASVRAIFNPMDVSLKRKRDTRLISLDAYAYAKQREIRERERERKRAIDRSVGGRVPRPKSRNRAPLNSSAFAGAGRAPSWQRDACARVYTRIHHMFRTAAVKAGNLCAF